MITLFSSVFLKDATIPLMVLESVHTIAFYETKLDICQNVLS